MVSASEASAALQIDSRLEEHLKLLNFEELEGCSTELAAAPIFTESVRRHALDQEDQSEECQTESESNTTDEASNGDESMSESRTEERSGSSGSNSNESTTMFTQYGLLGGDVNGAMSKKRDPRIFYNIAAPSSTFICGSQGSGKSHSLSCLLENCLLESTANELPNPLTGIVFHYDTFISDTGGSPCEAAYLSSHPDVSVRVLCAPTNIAQIERIYRKLPNVEISPLRINQSDLNTQRMLDLMAVSSLGGNGMPLYLHVVIRILRELRIEQQQTGCSFDYGRLKKLIDDEALKEGQLGPLQQRLETLESFMVREQAKAYDLFKPKQSGPSHNKKKAKNITAGTDLKRGTTWKPEHGQLTIVDLSCPCVTAEMACSLFGICLSLFLEQGAGIGKVIALDEAHKYMTDSPECQALTESLLSTIRLQRHLGARIIISTQEPTISPRLLDLCSVTIVHRFTSPDWLVALSKHLAGASSYVKALDSNDEPDGSNNEADGSNNEADGSDLESDDGDLESDDSDLTHEDSGITPLSLDASNISASLFSQIVALRTGEALLFAPSAIIGMKNSEDVMEPVRLGNGVLKIRVRKRVTMDGGKSIMAS